MQQVLSDLNSRSWRKRAQAADDLCAKPDPLAREMLVQLLDDPVAEVRANAASALGSRPCNGRLDRLRMKFWGTR